MAQSVDTQWDYSCGDSDPVRTADSDPRWYIIEVLPSGDYKLGRNDSSGDNPSPIVVPAAEFDGSSPCWTQVV